MQGRACATPGQGADFEVAFPSWERRGQPKSTFLGFRQQNRPSLACLGVTEYTGATNTSRSLRPTALHKTSGLTTDRQRNWEAVWGPSL